MCLACRPISSAQVPSTSSVTGLVQKRLASAQGRSAAPRLGGLRQATLGGPAQVLEYLGDTPIGWRSPTSASSGWATDRWHSGCGRISRARARSASCGYPAASSSAVSCCTSCLPASSAPPLRTAGLRAQGRAPGGRTGGVGCATARSGADRVGGRLSAPGGRHCLALLPSLRRGGHDRHRRHSQTGGSPKTKGAAMNHRLSLAPAFLARLPRMRATASFALTPPKHASTWPCSPLCQGLTRPTVLVAAPSCLPTHAENPPVMNFGLTSAFAALQSP